MLTFGAAERTRFGELRSGFSAYATESYDESRAYHDGGWMMFEVRDGARFAGLTRLLEIKAGGV